MQVRSFQLQQQPGFTPFPQLPVYKTNKQTKLGQVKSFVPFKPGNCSSCTSQLETSAQVHIPATQTGLPLALPTTAIPLTRSLAIRKGVVLNCLFYLVFSWHMLNCEDALPLVSVWISPAVDKRCCPSHVRVKIIYNHRCRAKFKLDIVSSKFPPLAGNGTILLLIGKDAVVDMVEGCHVLPHREMRTDR